MSRVAGAGIGRRLGPAAVIALMITAIATAATLWYFQYRPDSRLSDDHARAALEAADAGTVALLSYAPDTLEQDLATAKEYLTGDFSRYYSEFTEQVVTPAARQNSVTTTASVVRSAMSELHPDSAVVLAFINQTTTSAERPEPSLTASSVRVTLTEVDGSWLISSFEPV